MRSLATTQVRESRMHQRINHRIFAGAATSSGPWVVEAGGVARRLLTFGAGIRFGFDRWEANPHGSTRWRVLICETLPEGALGDCVPDVRPMVKVLADVRGSTRAQTFMAWLQARQDELWGLAEEEWARVHLYFNRMPLARLRGVQAAALELSDAG